MEGAGGGALTVRGAGREAFTPAHFCQSLTLWDSFGGCCTTSGIRRGFLRGGEGSRGKQGLVHAGPAAEWLQVLHTIYN